MNEPTRQPLVYSCSGASSAAQMANHIAVRLDRLGVAEMSCIAGVGGDVKSLVRTALSGRSILALDGCPLHCAARILARHGLRPTWHYDLSEHGVRKRQHEDFDPAEGARMLSTILASLRGSAPCPEPSTEGVVAGRAKNAGSAGVAASPEAIQASRPRCTG